MLLLIPFQESAYETCSILVWVQFPLSDQSHTPILLYYATAQHIVWFHMPTMLVSPETFQELVLNSWSSTKSMILIFSLFFFTIISSFHFMHNKSSG